MEKEKPHAEAELEQRVAVLEKENAELKRQLEERLMCLCIPLDQIRFSDSYFESARQKVTPQATKESFRILEWKLRSEGFILTL